MAASHTPVQSIDRVLDIIEALSFQPHGMLLKVGAGGALRRIQETHTIFSMGVDKFALL